MPGLTSEETVIGPYVAPEGTVTVKLVAVAAVTVAPVAPKRTILLEAVVLKFVPVMVTWSLGFAETGEKEVITGGRGGIFAAEYQTEITLFSAVKVEGVASQFWLKALLKFTNNGLPTIFLKYNLKLTLVPVVTALCELRS